MLSGAESWSDIADYGEAQLEWLKIFLNLPSGIPSHDTAWDQPTCSNCLQICYASPLQHTVPRSRARLPAVRLMSLPYSIKPSYSRLLIWPKLQTVHSHAARQRAGASIEAHC